MRKLVAVSVALCLAILLVQQAEATPQLQLLDLTNKFGGQESFVQAVNSLINFYEKVTQELETLIRQGKSVSQAFTELMKQLPRMMA